MESSIKEQDQEAKKINRITDESFLKNYIDDEGITDITWNGSALYLQHNKKGRYLAPKQPTIQEVDTLVKRIADVKGKEITDAEPIMDTEIGYFRVNVIHKAVSPDGTTFALRVARPRLAISELSDLVSEKVAILLQLLVRAKTNILISGATGSGKTELQKLLVGFISDEQKIIMIEDTRDSHMKQLYPKKDINSWRTLSEDAREKKISIQSLIQAALRNNPDWIIVSETRGAEAADMLDSAKTEHGIITTLHAKGAGSIPTRLFSMIRQSPAYSRTGDILLGRDIVDLLPFGIHMKQDIINGEIVRRIHEVVEFTNFTDAGPVYEYVYRVNYMWNNATQTYEREEICKPISERSKNRLKDAKLYHLLPKGFQ
ncbi:CpaF/VirB11 family protein [Paenibacillus larvae]|uniref:Type II/IV secretion system protein n=1 Tax=Paenibacillus larvae subsp. larvae TaxID=147375 RepID=A0A2L1U7D8_9BACL|nr:CpaF/VirB11 family protein [Paenibacillus larvae]AVF28831.1 type II/IV secretion system protein [Paenibacillus larvae subsp. larvae]MCY9500293.1 CpaF/VirB11 family protein [Paenibacillus larvae]MCY9746959.1 CpaF/VirB11 family protein [Paenibacillus larvae]MCY9752453.1 CpaF/VirB11 family protein [Paenibacillus larvae]MDR5608845.1 CpaF/VirB11 family protein [Paenibacillus larvae]